MRTTHLQFTVLIIVQSVKLNNGKPALVICVVSDHIIIQQTVKQGNNIHTDT